MEQLKTKQHFLPVLSPPPPHEEKGILTQFQVNMKAMVTKNPMKLLRRKVELKPNLGTGEKMSNQTLKRKMDNFIIVKGIRSTGELTQVSSVDNSVVTYTGKRIFQSNTLLWDNIKQIISNPFLEMRDFQYF